MLKKISYSLSSLFALILFPVYANSAVQADQSVLNHTMPSLTGQSVILAEKYDGKVVLFVNVASKCGLTPQYKQLQALYEKHGEEGLAIVGVPCNQFNHQEPGAADEIASFCEKNYGVTFDLLAKQEVNGEGRCPLYADLISASGTDKPVAWNFEKFLVGRDGKLIGRYSPRMKPDAKELVEAVEQALAVAAKK